MSSIHLFDPAHEEGDESMQENYQNPMIHKAYDTLKDLSADEETRELAERREKALKDEAMFLNEARREGEKRGEKRGKIQGEIKTYQELLASGLLPKDMVEQKIAQLNRELKQLTRESATYPEH